MRDPHQHRSPGRVLAALIGALLLVIPASSPAAAASAPTYADPTDAVRAAAATADSYWKRSFRESDREYRSVDRVYGYVPGDGSACGDEPNVPGNARYCASENDIAYDRQWLGQAYQHIGDAFVYFVIGHEWAHAVQVQLGVEHRYSIQFELQADCLSGAYLAGEIDAGELRLEPGDVDELRAGLKVVGDPADVPWAAPGAHGSPEQREQAFAAGFDDGEDAC